MLDKFLFQAVVTVFSMGESSQSLPRRNRSSRDHELIPYCIGHGVRDSGGFSNRTRPG